MSHHLIHGNQLARVRTEYCLRVFRAWMQRQMQGLREANRIRRDHKHLMELSDELLDDIGLTRFDIGEDYHRRVPPNLASRGMQLW